MSHTLQIFGPAFLLPCSLTIINYAVGGELVSPSEVASPSGVNMVLLGTCPPTQNSLGVPLFPVLSAGKIMLFRFTSGSPVEIGATTSLNAVIPVMIQAPGN